MTLLGKGTVNLRSETLDLELRPVPKDQKLSPWRYLSTSRAASSTPRSSPARARPPPRRCAACSAVCSSPNQISALFGNETVDACVAALRQAQERRQEQATVTQPPT
jgi:hypothetical protein